MKTLSVIMIEYTKKAEDISKSNGTAKVACLEGLRREWVEKINKLYEVGYIDLENWIDCKIRIDNTVNRWKLYKTPLF